jgi:serine protease Do
MRRRAVTPSLWLASGAAALVLAGLFALGAAHAGLAPALLADDARPGAAASPPRDAGVEREKARESLKRDLAQDVARLESFSRAFRAVAKLVSPSVVHIRVSKELIVTDGVSADPFRDELLRRFFGLPDDDAPSGGRSRRAPVQQGEGSGVVYSPDGYILTNNHVVGGADRIEVRFHDGRALPARVVGADPKIDLAVVKVEATDLVPIDLAPPGAIDVGDWVVAVGNPFGLQHTVTAGIVSAIHRAGVGITDYESFVQTDAAINPGNSGGPLVDLSGRLVGINTAIASRTGGSMGVGFAIPVEMVRAFAPQLIEHGRVRRGWLGVSIQPIDGDLARRFSLPEASGALVGGVLPGGPASEAGLRTGDVLVSLDGAPVESPNGLRNRVAALLPGTKVRVGYFRDGKRAEATISLGELEDPEASAAADRRARLSPGSGAARPGGDAPEGERLGFSVRALTPAIARRIGVAPTVKGVLVDAVEPGGPAEAAGFQRGDVIEEVDRKPTPDLDAFDQAMREADPASGILVLVRRGDTTSYARIKSRP